MISRFFSPFLILEFLAHGFKLLFRNHSKTYNYLQCEKKPTLEKKIAEILGT